MLHILHINILCNLLKRILYIANYDYRNSETLISQSDNGYIIIMVILL